MKKQKSALVVDDDDFCLELAELVLSEFYQTVDVAVDETQAKNLLDAPDKYTAIFVDLNLEEMTGEQLIDSIGEFIDGSTKLYAVSSEDALKEGSHFSHLVSKPICKQKIRELLLQPEATALDASKADMLRTAEYSMFKDFDYGDVMMRLEGDAALLNRSLSRLLDELQKFMEAYKPQLLSGNMISLIAGLHKLVGLLRNLGFKMVAAQLSDLESKLRDGDAPLASEWDMAHQEMELLLSELNQFVELRESSRSTVTLSADAANIMFVIGEMKKHLKVDYSKCISLLNELEALKDNKDSGLNYAELESLIYSFDIDELEKYLSRVEAEMGTGHEVR